MQRCPRYPQLLQAKMSAVIQPDMLSAGLSVGFLQKGHILIFPEGFLSPRELTDDFLTLADKEGHSDSRMSSMNSIRRFKQSLRTKFEDR